jgi:hypothetical protein
MATKLTAVCRISYERSTDLIEVIGRRTTGALPKDIEAYGYEVLSRTIQGWGDYNAIISCDGFDAAAGTFLAKFTEVA